MADKPCPFRSVSPEQILLERPLALVKRDGYWEKR